MTIPLKTRKRVLEALGWKVELQSSGAWKLLRPNGDFYGTSLDFFSEHDAFFSSDSVPLDANLCEREILPYMYDAAFDFYAEWMDGDCCIAGFSKEESSENSHSGTGDSLSTAIALAFNAYLEAQQ